MAACRGLPPYFIATAPEHVAEASRDPSSTRGAGSGDTNLTGAGLHSDPSPPPPLCNCMGLLRLLLLLR